MGGLVINPEKCVGCGLCVKGCSFGALRMENRKAVVNKEACVLCGVCVDSCRFGAISIQKEEAAADLSAYSGIWVFAEQHEGCVLNVAYELLGKGRELADAKNCALTALLLGADVSGAADRLIAYGADRVLLCESPRLAENSDESYSDVITGLIAREKPDMLLFGATGFGRSLAPRIAARVRTGLTADCTVLRIDPETGLLEQTRPAFGGNLMATIICPNHRPQMATVRPGVMPAQEPDPARRGEIVRVSDPGAARPLVEFLSAVHSGAAESIADAEIIVSAGKGIGAQKNMALIRELAELLGGSVGVSRPLVDAGWCEYKNQIGQTGCTVAPKLLIACGISGAIQHLAGIGGAKTIVAINNDPQAPIFALAHYAVVGDCAEVLKELIAAVKEKKACLKA
jgi:electron transfer flavoprotein alpha subunit